MGSELTPHRPDAAALRGRCALLQRRPWLIYLLPLLVFMLVGTLEPKPPSPDVAARRLEIPYRYYPAVYIAKIFLTAAAVWVVWPGYRKFPVRVSLLAILVGAVGIVAWVGACQLQWEQQYFPRLGLGWLLESGARSAYDPFKELREYPRAVAWSFLAVRFVGLVMVVPVIEEFFLRGFLMRFVMKPDWESVPFGRVNTAAVVVGTLFPMLMHPAELLAAAVWFSLITVLMVKTKSIWDCIAAHATTNFLLGLYVLASGQWRLI